MSGTDLELLYLKAGGSGWGPIDALASLASRLLDARLVTVEDQGEVSRLAKASALLPRRRKRGKRLLVLAANPALLAYVARREHWLPGYEQVAAWVIDSFWTERVSRFALEGRHFDQIFITDKDLVPQWREMTKTPTEWLPWGTDTLAVDQTAVGKHRPVDLLRMGRQPAAWDDDAATILDGRQHGIVVAGRPPMGATGAENQRIVRQSMLDAKFVLAFHNLVSSAPYTHPTRSYVTARWTDALAAGATLVGAAPQNARDILWDEATVEIPPDDLRGGLENIRHLVDGWAPSKSVDQHRLSRRRLDWRWRLQELVDLLGWGEQAPLRRELRELQEG